MAAYMERALFVIGPRNSGKSTVLRSMFLDKRFGKQGIVPKKARVADIHLSTERLLRMRIASPHEAGETIAEFLSKAGARMSGGRWNFVSPLHPLSYKNMPDAVTTIGKFQAKYHPERIRVIFISPTQSGEVLDDYAGGRDLVKELLAISSSVEVALIDNRSQLKSMQHNGLLLADFFDFT